VSDQTPPTPPSSPDGATPPQAPPAPPAAPPYAPAYGAAQPPAYGEQPPAYGQQPPAYGQAPGYAPYPYSTAPKTNALAIVSLVSAVAAFVVLPFIGSLVAVITGHIALRQLKTSGESGRGMALGGTITGWVSLGLGIVVIAFFVFIAIAAAAAGAGAYNSYS
jgi:hypothetical protein